MFFEKAMRKAKAILAEHVHIKALLFGSAMSICGAILAGVLSYLTRRIMANGLPTESYGYFYSVFSLCSLCIALTEFGTQSAGVILISRYLASGRKSRADAAFNMIILFNAAMGLLVAAALAAASPWLIRDFFKYDGNGLPCFLLLLLFIVWSSIETIVRGGLTASKDFLSFNIVNTTRTALLCALTFVVLPLFGISGAAAAFAISAAVSAFVAFKLLRGRVELKLKLGFSKGILKKTFKLCSWMTLSGAGLTSLFYLDTLCLNWLGGLNDVALYHIALPLMQLTMGLIVMPMVFMPIAAELWEKGKRRQIKTCCLAMAAGALLGLTLLAVLGDFAAALAIKILFGAKFIEATRALTWLWAGMIFYAVAQFNIAALNAGGLQKLPAMAIVSSIPLNIALNALLIPRFGINGAAAATAASYFAIAVWTGSSLWRKLGDETVEVKAAESA